jgi:hypothetical protein
MQLNPFTLTFAGEERGLEAAFRADYYAANRRTIRWTLLAGLGAYVCFGVLDVLVFPEAYHRLWWLRFGIACPAILLTLLATFAAVFARVWQPVLAVAIVVSGVAIVAMTVVAPPPFNHTYYAGVALVLVYGFALSRLRFLWATVAGWCVVLAYESSALALVATPWQVLAGNSFFFISTNLLGMVACYVMEYHARRHFWMERQLAEEKSKVQSSHQELEERIEELRRERETVRELRGLIPICSHCMRIRDDKGYWNQLEQFIRERSHAEFSHGICPECAEKFYGEYLK